MRRKIVPLGGVILLLLIGITFWLSFSKQYVCKGDNRPIPFKRLSDERSFPFLDTGHPPSYWKHNSPYPYPYYDKYHLAITRFPDVRTCLKDSEKEKQMPNLTHFDWDKIKGIEDAKVCMFRVYSSIGSIEGSKQWLESQGFSIDNIFKEGFGKEEVTSIQAYAVAKKCGQRFREDYGINLLGWLTSIDNHTLGVSPVFSSSEEVTSVGAWFIYN
jgi:hypothetical protein